MSKVEFPTVNISEWNPFRTSTVSGLFFYRHLQASNLLRLPDYGGLELNPAQRRLALENAVVANKPMTALVVFLNVVALEDLIRNLGIQLSNSKDLQALFSKINELNTTTPKVPDPNKPSKQLDKDPFSILDYIELNKKYYSVLGVEPIPAAEHPRLYDLSIIRHTVAHNGSVIRPIDEARFQYYDVKANQTINPPIAFVNETTNYLFNIGIAFEKNIRYQVFQTVFNKYGKDALKTKSKIVIDLIELFNFFGFLPQNNNAVGITTEEQASIYKSNYDELIGRCFDELYRIHFTDGVITTN